ncbi:hypothetical protein LC55x_4488 [Lysobacter capsici]|nr:hypothetical protein LC55x_4488 [Lysobacter capsici]
MIAAPAAAARSTKVAGENRRSRPRPAASFRWTKAHRSVRTDLRGTIQDTSPRSRCRKTNGDLAAAVFIAKPFRATQSRLASPEAGLP